MPKSQLPVSRFLCLFVLTIVFFPCITSGQKTTTDTGYTYHKASADGIGKCYFGREISFVMGAGGSYWLERGEREEEENTRLAIEKIDLPPAATIADIGAGTGYYSFQLAKKFSAGKIFAVEIQDEMIAYLEKRKETLHNKNVEIIKGSDHSPHLQPNSIDMALMVDVYHELAFPHEMLQSLRQSLKPKGKILLLEFRGEDPKIAIKPLHKTTVEQLNKEMEANGFRLSCRGEFLPVQHFLVYEKI
jgi:SAM-dependent methyltransferase